VLDELAEIIGDLQSLAMTSGMDADTINETAPSIVGLPVCVKVAARDNVTVARAAVAVVERAVAGLHGSEGRWAVPRKDIAGAALAIDDRVRGVLHLHRRLVAVSGGVTVSAARRYWRDVRPALAQAILSIYGSEVEVVVAGAAGGDTSLADFVAEETDTLWTLDGKRVTRVVTTKVLTARRSVLTAFSFPISYPLDPREGVINPVALLTARPMVISGQGSDRNSRICVCRELNPASQSDSDTPSTSTPRRMTCPTCAISAGSQVRTSASEFSLVLNGHRESGRSAV
jgi:hypothetical protein